MRCDVETLMCVPAPGTGVVDDECVDDDQCAAPLVCVDGRCRELCAMTQQCANSRICTVADAPLPGLCLAPCNLLVPNCSTPSDACKRGVDADGELVAVCTYNPGAGVEGSACERDGDCEIGFVCTPANQHTLPCAEDAAACCAALCDVNQLPCFGLEPFCILLGIADQPDAGYCGAT